MDGEEKIVVVVPWRPESLAIATMHHVRPLFWKALGMGAVVLMLVYWDRFHDPIFLATAPLLAIVYIAILSVVRSRWLIARRLRRSNAHVSPEKLTTTWTFSASGIETKAELGRGDLNWPAIREIVRIPAGFMFYIQKDLFYWVPIDVLPDAAAADRLAALLRAHAPAYRDKT